MQTSLLALHDASVAGQEASLLQGGAVGITIDGVQSAGNAEADGAGLAGGAAAVNETIASNLPSSLSRTIGELTSRCSSLEEVLTPECGR